MLATVIVAIAIVLLSILVLQVLSNKPKTEQAAPTTVPSQNVQAKSKDAEPLPNVDVAKIPEEKPEVVQEEIKPTKSETSRVIEQTAPAAAPFVKKDELQPVKEKAAEITPEEPKKAPVVEIKRKDPIAKIQEREVVHTPTEDDSPRLYTGYRTITLQYLNAFMDRVNEEAEKERKEKETKEQVSALLGNFLKETLRRIEEITEEVDIKEIMAASENKTREEVFEEVSPKNKITGLVDIALDVPYCLEYPLTGNLLTLDVEKTKVGEKTKKVYSVSLKPLDRSILKQQQWVFKANGTIASAYRKAVQIDLKAGTVTATKQSSKETEIPESRKYKVIFADEKGRITRCKLICVQSNTKLVMTPSNKDPTKVAVTMLKPSLGNKFSEFLAQKWVFLDESYLDELEKTTASKIVENVKRKAPMLEVTKRTVKKGGTLKKQSTLKAADLLKAVEQNRDISLDNVSHAGVEAKMEEQKEAKAKAEAAPKPIKAPKGGVAIPGFGMGGMNAELLAKINKRKEQSG